MSIRHLWAVSRKEFQHIIRDRSTLFLVIVTPTVLLLIMAYALTVNITNVPLAVMDLDRSSLSRAFIQQITAGEDLDYYTNTNSFGEIEDLLIQGEIKAALIIDPSFSHDLKAMRGMPLQVIVDGTEPESGTFAVEHITRRAEEFATRTLQQGLASPAITRANLQPISLRVRTWFNPGLKPRNDLIPGLISMVLGFPALSVALTLAHEREHGTLEQLMATPIGKAELLVGKMIPYVLVGMLNVLVIPLLAMAWFNVPFNGNFLLFIVLSAVFLFAMLSMGIIVGVFMPTQAAALALSFLLIFFPGFFLTGIFFPLTAMPEMIRLEAMGLPGTHYAVITRGLFLPGVGLKVLWPYVVMLIGLGLAFTGVSALFFRKKLG